MSKKTKEALIAAFLDLIGEKEFDKITVTDLVEACKMSRQTFYYHFDDIHGMLKWAVDFETSKICEAQNPENWEETEENYIGFFNKYDVVLRKSLKSIDVVFVLNLIDKSFYDFIKSYISSVRSEEQSFGKNADYVISFTAGAYTALVVKTIQNETSDYETIIRNLSTSLKGI